MTVTSENTVSPLLQELARYDQVSSPSERERQKALATARKLVHELSSPGDILYHDVYLAPTRTACTRIAVDLKVFHMLAEKRNEAITIAQITQESGAEVMLVEQIMRVLAVSGLVEQVSADSFKATKICAPLAEDQNEGATRFFLDIIGLATLKAADFCRRNGFKHPKNNADTPFQLAFDTKLPCFPWFAENGILPDFYKTMQVLGAHQAHWTDFYPIEQKLIHGANSDGPLLVDVGGGNGEHLERFLATFPGTAGRLVLQDLPATVTELKLSAGIQVQSHDFFTVQPVKGARAYFMRYIMHDWPDDDCVKILQPLAEAMTPGYSSLLINDSILSDTAEDEFGAQMSIIMMCFLGAAERGRAQWERLSKRAGLKIVAFHDPPSQGEGFIEMIKEA